MQLVLCGCFPPVTFTSALHKDTQHPRLVLHACTIIFTCREALVWNYEINLRAAGAGSTLTVFPRQAGAIFALCAHPPSLRCTGSFHSPPQPPQPHHLPIPPAPLPKPGPSAVMRGGGNSFLPPACHGWRSSPPLRRPPR